MWNWLGWCGFCFMLLKYKWWGMNCLRFPRNMQKHCWEIQINIWKEKNNKTKISNGGWMKNKMGDLGPGKTGRNPHGNACFPYILVATPMWISLFVSIFSWNIQGLFNSASFETSIWDLNTWWKTGVVLNIFEFLILGKWGKTQSDQTSSFSRTCPLI